MHVGLLPNFHSESENYNLGNHNCQHGLIHPHTDQTWVEAIKEWQTIISAILALMAASWTVKTIEKQIHDERERHNEIVARKALSMRAKMPDAINEIIDYTKRCFTYLQDQNAALPTFCPDAIQVFKDSIEFIDSESSAAIYEMVSFYQIHNARLENPIYETESRILDTLKLSHYALRSFEYARNEAQSISNHQPSRNDILTALKTVVGYEEYHMNPERYQEMRRIVEQNYPRSD